MNCRTLDVTLIGAAFDYLFVFAIVVAVAVEQIKQKLDLIQSYSLIGIVNVY